MEKPLVGILIPTQNNSATVARCMESLIAQDYENLMVGILDNASTDDTYDILLEYERQDRKRIFVARNYSKSNPLNLILRVRGLVSPRIRQLQYLMPTDSLQPTYVSRCLEFFAAHEKMGAISVHAEALHPDGRLSPARPWRASQVVLSGDAYLESLMVEGMERRTLEMYRTEIHDFAYSEGLLFNRHPSWLPRLMAGTISDVGYLPDPLAARGDAASLLGPEFVPDQASVFEQYLFLQSFAGIAQRLGKTAISDQLPTAVAQLGQACIRHASLLLDAGQGDEAQARLSMALAYHPALRSTPEFAQVARRFPETPLDWR